MDTEVHTSDSVQSLPEPHPDDSLTEDDNELLQFLTESESAQHSQSQPE